MTLPAGDAGASADGRLADGTQAEAQAEGEGPENDTLGASSKSARGSQPALHEFELDRFEPDTCEGAGGGTLGASLKPARGSRPALHELEQDRFDRSVAAEVDFGVGDLAT